MLTKSLPKISLLATAIALATGCSMAPKYETPETQAPASLVSSAGISNLQVPANEQAWWAQFNDPELKGLLKTALANNSDYQIAEERLYQARAALTGGKAEKWPQVNLQGEVGRTQTSANNFDATSKQTFGNNQLGIGISYELDLWGRVRSTNESLNAKYQAMTADKQALRLSVGAAVAQAYFNVRALDQMVQIAKNTVQSRKENLDLRQRQYELGGLTQLAVQQAEVEFSRVEIQLINLKQQRDMQRNVLSSLLGETPEQMVKRSKSSDADPNFAKVHLPALPAELSSEMLLRRPDIQAAEQRLIAANADIGVARASRFPTISLNGTLGVSSESLSDLFNSDSEMWNINAGILAPIFNAGALKAKVKISEAEQRIMLLNYQQAVRNAFAESLDALTLQHRSEEQLEAQQRQVAALRKTLDLAQKRFDSGYSSYLEVLDAQRMLFDSEVAMVETKLNSIKANIQLYKAIGGHWQQD